LLPAADYRVIVPYLRGYGTIMQDALLSLGGAK
jgi:hypothetical protein